MMDPGAQRIDKWLWHARFVRTRAAAQQLATSGHVRVNRDKVTSASRLVRPGDVLTLALERDVRVVRVCGIAARRGSFETARRLYETEMAPGAASGNAILNAAPSAARRPLNGLAKADTPPSVGRVRSKP